MPVAAYIHLTGKNPYTEEVIHCLTQRLYACAEDKRWNIVCIRTDTGNTLPYQRRPGFCSMIDVMKENNVSMILTPSLRHITRSMPPLPVGPAAFYFYAVREQLLAPFCPDLLV